MLILATTRAIARLRLEARSLRRKARKRLAQIREE